VLFDCCSPNSLMNQEPLLNEDDDNEEESLELQEVVIDKQPQVMWVLFKSRLIVNPEITMPGQPYIL